MNDSNQNICENMIEIQEDLEVLLNKIFDCMENKTMAEKQAAYTLALQETKQVIERCKNQYNCVVFLSQDRQEIEGLDREKTISSQYSSVK